jgi:hypothetical protein
MRKVPTAQLTPKRIPDTRAEVKEATSDREEKTRSDRGTNRKAENKPGRHSPYQKCQCRHTTPLGKSMDHGPGILKDRLH